MVVLLSLAAFAGPLETGRQHLDPRGRLDLVGDAVPWPGGTLVRYAQRMQGLPVHGRPLVVSIGLEGQVRRATGRPAGPSPVTTPAVDRDQAVAVARQLGARLGRGAPWPPRPELIWLEDDGGLRLVWRVDLSTVEPLGTWRTHIDAVTGRIVRTDLTSRSARAWVYPSNPSISPLREVVLPGLPGDATTLAGTHASLASCDAVTLESGWFGRTACDAASAQAAADPAGDFFFEPDPVREIDPFAEVQAYFHLDRVAAFLDGRYGFRHRVPIRGYVNFELANAFYGDFDGDGKGDVAFGHAPGTEVDFAYDADVVYHEFGHAVVGALANLPFLAADAYGMDWTAGSANEGYADILAMVLTGDPRVGEFAGSAFDLSAIRDLDADRRCPDDLVGAVHADGQVLGALAWNLVERVGPEITHDVFFGAIPFWGQDVSWPVIGQTLLDAAADLRDAGALDDLAHSVVIDEVRRANLLGCGRVLPLASGVETRQAMLNLGLLGDLSQIPLGMQFSVDVPPTASAVRFEVTGVDGHEGLGWAVYGRSGSHVEHEVLAVDLLGLAVARPAVFDWHVDGEGARVLELLPDGDLPFVPGERLHLAVASRNLGSIGLLELQSGTIGLRAEVVMPAAPAASGTAASNLAGGSGCRTAPVGRGWSLALAMWVLRRRERAR